MRLQLDSYGMGMGFSVRRKLNVQLRVVVHVLLRGNHPLETPVLKVES